MINSQQYHYYQEGSGSFADSQKSLHSLHFVTDQEWPSDPSNSHMREVPNPEEQLLLMDTMIFNWITTSALQNQTFSNNSANAYFHLQTSGFMSPFHIPFSKSRLFPHHFKQSQWCFSYLSTELLAALVPSDMSQQPFHDTPQGEVTQLLQTCFSFLSAPGISYCHREQSITLTRVTELLHCFCKVTTYT